MTQKKISRALISVYDKTGIVELATELAARNIELISSDGTAELLRNSGLKVRTVSEITGSPEILGGKVKTLHPAIHGAVLVDQNDPKQMAELDVLGPIDLLVINFYPVEGFDIGGPALVRAGAKNSEHVAVITSTNQYSELISTLDSGTSLEQRKSWALEALVTTAEYDLSLAGERGKVLRYGENPQQHGVLISRKPATVFQGKEMSYNNYLDIEAGRRVVDFCAPALAIVKHGIPCGIAQGATALEAFQNAWSCNPTAAFGGVVVSTFDIDEACALELSKVFIEVVAAPKFHKAAREVLSAKTNLRLVELDLRDTKKVELRSISDGYLMQQSDQLKNPGDEFSNWSLVSGTAASEQEKLDLVFAWRAAAAARSNSVVIVKQQKAIGIGAGSVSRVTAAKMAIAVAQENSPSELTGSVAASDAFFPFSDGIEVLIAAGVKAIVQPGGSIRDEDVIAAAKAAGISMYLTGVRHFSH